MSTERDPFVPIGFAAHAVGRSHRTLRSWARDGTVRRRDDREHVEVHVGDAARAAEIKGRRHRSSDA